MRGSHSFLFLDVRMRGVNGGEDVRAGRTLERESDSFPLFRSPESKKV